MSEAANQDVAPDLNTSPIYRIKGQVSRWQYPDKRLTPEDAVYIRNVNLSEFGSADSRYGTVLYNATQIPSAESVTGLIQEKFTTGTHQFVITPTKIYHDTGSVRTDLTGALTLNGDLNNRTRHAFTRDKIVGTNSVNATWVKDNGGATGAATALAGVPWTTCDDLLVHKGILVALAPTESGTKQATRVRWCDINTRTFVPDITVWRADSRYEVYEGGTAIVGGVDNWNKILVFKEDGLYAGSLEWAVGFIEYRPVDPVQRGFHPIAKHSLVTRPDFIWGIAREGPFVIRPDLTIEMLVEDIQDVWATLNQSRLQYAISWIREGDTQVRTLLSDSSSNTFNLIMVWDWETGDIFFDTPTATMNFGARAVISNEEIDWFGSTSGYLYTGNLPTSQSDNGTGISWQIRMAPNDLGVPGVTKHIVDLITLFRTRTNEGSITCNVYRDQGQKTTRTRTLNLSTNLVWNGGILWNSGQLWGGSQVREAKFFVNRTAENILPEWIGNNPASLIGYQVTFTVQEN